MRGNAKVLIEGQPVRAEAHGTIWAISNHQTVFGLKLLMKEF